MKVYVVVFTLKNGSRRAAEVLAKNMKSIPKIIKKDKYSKNAKNIVITKKIKKPQVLRWLNSIPD